MTEIPNADFNKMREDLVRLAAMRGIRHENLQEVFKFYYQRVEKLEALPQLEPRKVSAPPAYLPFKGVASGLFGVLDEMAMKAALHIEQIPVDITAASVIYEVVRNSVPVYFVAEDFIRAVAATELPSDFTINDLHWPMPAMVLGFPAKFMREFLGREICYVNCANFKASSICPCPVKAFDSLKTIIVPEAKVAWQWYCVQNGNLESYVACYRTGDRVNEAMAKYAYVDYTDGPADKVAEDRAMIDRLSGLILKLLVILNTRPSLVVPGVLERPLKIKHGKIKHCAIWSPNTIGAAYHVQRAAPVGTHASPRFHFRRGHITHQRIGSPKACDFVSVNSMPRREDGEIDWSAATEETKQSFWRCHRRVWLEPIPVNLDADDDSNKTKI